MGRHGKCEACGSGEAGEERARMKPGRLETVRVSGRPDLALQIGRSGMAQAAIEKECRT